MLADLHCHSYCSDGRLPPAEVVDLAHQAGVTHLALTDHDTLAGLPEASARAELLGMQLLPGVEISTRWKGHEIHVVGLCMCTDDVIFRQRMVGQQAVREARAIAIAARLGKLGFGDDCYQRVLMLAGAAEVSRAHFARLLLQEGKVNDMQQAFDRYLGIGKAAYVAADWPSPTEAVQWLREAGGLPVLAHPGRYKMTRTRLRALMQEFAEAGGAALEIVTSSHDADMMRWLDQQARHLGLAYSCGSDFHDPAYPWIALGRLPAIKLASRFVLEL